ncbi:CRTAC1 family protein [Mangrovihabitans endophyticus]|uniref:RNA-binding protein n=1 Tax=Mangrovihabitans endophyticus TaxID=1751298 RepID=A0A8J3BWK1_9ACTN|nr:CRTAC1 family protein [Mangrovihabitans endophyticus]GGK76471.1 RNA-binding protein [Mangrovihabitans endophyticus]
MQIRKSMRSAVVVLLAAALIVTAGAATRRAMAKPAPGAALTARFAFESSDVNGDPADTRTVRPVAPALRHIRSWISAVGASVGLADFDGDRVPGEACLVDPRDDSVTVRAVRPAARFTPVALRPAGVPYDAATTAPMGCVPADLNEDGHTDVLVYFWGRAPLAYLRRPAAPLTPAAFVATDIAPRPGIWNSTTANVLDVDGDGHLDVIVANYFPDGARVLDSRAAHDPLMRMQDSMSDALNAGRNRILRLDRIVRGGAVAVPRYADASAAFTTDQARGWTLAVGAQDLDGDARPEIYLANDFGPDRLLQNRSAPGRIRFTELHGRRDLGMPKSKVVGDDSFKGMGVTYTDLNRDGRPDIVVSNITSPYGLQESNFAFVSTGTGPLTGGAAPYRDESEPLGLSRSGWGWDIKAADFDGDGTDEITQAVGFLAGRTNRWAQLQELAMSNDAALQYPWAWPDFGPDADLSGHQQDPFYVRGADGRYLDLASDLGLRNHGPSRGIAIGDVDHDGRLDALVANQWARSQMWHNTGPARSYLGLRPLLPPQAPGDAPRPAVGATVTVTSAGGMVRSAQLYPANGHTGVNAPELLFGLGAPSPSPASVRVTWRDAAGRHTTTATLRPGWHDIVLDDGR